jgi:hypothetical protein
MNESDKSRWVWRIGIAIALLVILYFVGCVYYVVWNTEVHGQVAREMAASLGSQHPELTFRGAAGYPGMIHITVSELPDAKTQQAIRAWLTQEVEYRNLRTQLHVLLNVQGPASDSREWYYNRNEANWTEVR